MKMNVKDFYALVNKEADPVADMLPDLEQLIRKYPYFQAGIFIYLKCLYLSDSDKFDGELSRLSTFVHDRRALFYYVLSEAFDKFLKYNSKPLSEDRTNILLNAFFETQNSPSLSDQLDYDLDSTSMASSDYLSYLTSSEPKETPIEISNDTTNSIETEESITEYKLEETPKMEMKHQSIIDSFIENAEKLENIKFNLEPVPEDEEELPMMDDSTPDDSNTELDDDFFFTQTLANIYIKQKKYNRAYEIIKRLNLNYPEKNIYFADQLKFLEKVIKNTSNK